MAEAQIPSPDSSIIAVVGDVHGHLQLALCMLARWQRQLGLEFEAVLLCGDVGTFTEPWQLDNATRSHAKRNECELEFMYQWARHPQPPWLAKIFESGQPDGDGLGLTCPVVMVHGNHEGFEHLATLIGRSRPPRQPVPLEELRGVDSAELIRYLPSGWRTVTPSGLVIGGIGGMESGQRPRTRYHPLAYIDQDAVEALLAGPSFDVLLTHQGPTDVQGDHGSPTLQLLLDEEVARVWFHGHSTPQRDPITAGPREKCLVVPLGDIAFPGRGRTADDPGLEGWCYFRFLDGKPSVTKETPPFWRDLRSTRWSQSPDGGLVAPDVQRFLWQAQKGAS